MANHHENTILLIGGLPGSGKTSLAKILANPYGESTNAPMLAADDFFYREGAYKFNPAKLQEAHEWCQSRVARYMGFGEPLLIVHNTFTQHWETQPYRKLADEYGYRLFFVTLGDGGESLQSLCDRNLHGVPLDVLSRMKDGECVISTHGLDARPPWARKD